MVMGLLLYVGRQLQPFSTFCLLVYRTVLQIVRRLRGRKHHNCLFCDKRTIFTGSSPFNMTIYIRYGGISKINPDSLKFKIS